MACFNNEMEEWMGDMNEGEPNSMFYVLCFIFHSVQRRESKAPPIY